MIGFKTTRASRLNLGPCHRACGYGLGECSEIDRRTRPLCKVSSSSGSYFPLLIIKRTNHRPLKRMHSCPFSSRAAAGRRHLLRVLLDIHVGLVVEILDFEGS